MKAEIILVLGGARSGKSEVAERLAAAQGRPVTYLATGPAPEGDPDWAERVARHRDRRPAEWTTVELGPGGDIAAALAAFGGALLIDSLGTWVAGLSGFGAEVDRDVLTDALVARRDAGHPTVVVSEEVGLGVHPSTSAGREFRDALGALNRRVADVADDVHLVVAGRTLRLSGPSA